MVSAQVSMPAAAQTISDSADVTRLQNDFENNNKLPQKSESPPPEAVPENEDSASTMSGARLITATELEKFLGPDVALKDGITKIDAASGVAYSWQSGSLSGRAEQQPLRDPAGFDGQVSKYLARIRDRCSGSFAARPGLKKEENGVVVSSYEAACVGEAGSTSASVLFYSQNGLFTAIAHEGSLDDMDAGMDIRDKLADKLLQFMITSSPISETPAAPLGGSSVNDNAASPPPQGSLRSKDPMSDARLITAAELEKFLGPDVTLKGGITKIDGGSGVAYSWQSGSLSGRAEQQKLRDPAGFDGQVSKYLARSKGRCTGTFAAKQGLKKEENGLVVSSYDVACVGEAGSTSASVLFYSQNGLFTSIAHDGSLDDMDATMDIRDKLADKFLQFEIASAPAVETPAAPPGGSSVNDNAASPPPQGSLRSKDPMSVGVAAQSLGADDSGAANPGIPAAAPVAPVKEDGVLPEITGKAENPVHESVSLDSSGSLTPAPPETMGPSAPPGLTASPANASKAGAAVNAAGPAAAGEGADEDLLLQLVVNDEEMEDVVDAVPRGGKLYLPLGQLSLILDFNITVDKAAKTAKGWFIREQNTFALNPQAAEIKGKTMALPPGGVFADDKDLYVDSALLQDWWPLDYKFDRLRLTLNITTRETLPFEAKLLRKKKQATLDQQSQPAKDLVLKKIDVPYSTAQWPTVDLTMSPSYDSRSHGARGDYSMLAVGDFGYLTTRLYAAGDLGSHNVSDLRLSAGRDDSEAGLLGPAHASSFLFGDINSATLSQVATPTQGRGFTVTNRALDRPDNFDATNFIGETHPGWDVELYRNGTLISSQTVGGDGRYNFANVPVIYGNNQFRIAFFGPQGQVEEINKTVNAASALLEKGQFTYNLSANQQNQTLFGLSDQFSTLPTGLNTVSEFEYGLTRWVTLAAGGAHTVLQDGSGHNYGTAGLRASAMGVLATLDEAYDTTSHGDSTRLSLSTDIHDTLLSFQQTFARDFESEEDIVDLANPVDRQTVARADKQLNIGALGPLSSSFTYTLKQYQSGRDETLWTNQLSKTVLGNITLTNTLQDDRDNRGLDQFTGAFNLRGTYGHTLLGGELDYSPLPQAAVNSFKLSALYPFSPAISDNFTLTSQLTGGKSNQIANTVTFDLSRYKLSVTGSISDPHDLFLGLTVNISIGRVPGTGKWIMSGKPLAETGAVAVSPYIDSNYNQQRDPAEAAPPNASMRIGSQTLKVDKNGDAIATLLPVNTPVRIMMDPDDQKANPSLSSGVDAYTVVPRPGKVIAVNFPLFETSQIEGTVSAPPGEKPAGLVVELVNVDGQVIRQAHSAFDGYYLLADIMPGSYKIRIADSSLKDRGLKQANQPSLTITVSDYFVKDIQLTAAGGPGAPPPQEPAAEDKNRVPSGTAPGSLVTGMK
jgi:hypothetical protein